MLAAQFACMRGYLIVFIDSTCACAWNSAGLQILKSLCLSDSVTMSVYIYRQTSQESFLVH